MKSQLDELPASSSANNVIVAAPETSVPALGDCVIVTVPAQLSVAVTNPL